MSTGGSCGAGNSASGVVRRPEVSTIRLCDVIWMAHRRRLQPRPQKRPTRDRLRASFRPPLVRIRVKETLGSGRYFSNPIAVFSQVRQAQPAFAGQQFQSS